MDWQAGMTMLIIFIRNFATAPKSGVLYTDAELPVDCLGL
jgi:hypothetical protein